MSKTFVYYANVNNLIIEDCLNCLPSFRIVKIIELEKEKDKKLSAGVWLLLEKAFKKHNLMISNYEFKTLDNGKPYFENCPIQISYSHSGEFVAVALSDKPVGIDIQEIQPIDKKVIDFISNDNDRNYLEKHPDSFNKIWSLKEATGKITGIGLSKKVIDNYEKTFIYEKIKGYILVVAPNNDIEIEELFL